MVQSTGASLRGEKVHRLVQAVFKSSSNEKCKILMVHFECAEAVDLWAIGCILGELLTFSPIFPGENDIDQLGLVIRTLGTPNERIWPGVKELPDYSKITFPGWTYSSSRVCLIRLLIWAQISLHCCVLISRNFNLNMTRTSNQHQI